MSGVICSFPSPTALPGSQGHRARPGCAPRARPGRHPLGLVAGLQQAGAVPLRRRLVSRGAAVGPGSGTSAVPPPCRDTGNGADLAGGARGSSMRSAAARGRAEPLLEAPGPPLRSERSPVGSGEGAGPPRRSLRAGGGVPVPRAGLLLREGVRCAGKILPPASSPNQLVFPIPGSATGCWEMEVELHRTSTPSRCPDLLVFPGRF